MLISIIEQLNLYLQSLCFLFKENSDREWKFARSSIWMHYFERKSFLPNPLNVLPCVQDLLDIGHWCVVKIKNDHDQRAKFSTNVRVYFRLRWHCAMIVILGADLIIK